MTQKQFKEVLGLANIPVEIWGYEGYINLMIMGLRRCVDSDRQHGFESLAQRDEEKIEVLTNYLESIGFFEV